MTDDPDTAELENRIEKLEATIEKVMPSRRDALKMGGAALVGGSLMAGTASAGTNQVGTIGSASQPVDLESEDINNADTVTTQDLVVNGTATGPFGSSPQAAKIGLSVSSSASPVPFDNILFDTGSNYDVSKSAYVVPEDGIYMSVFSGQTDNAQIGDNEIFDIVSANQGILARARRQLDTSFGSFNVTTIASLIQGDEIFVENTFSTPLIEAPLVTSFSVAKLG